MADMSGKITTISGSMVGVQFDDGGYLIMPLKTDKDGRLYVELPPKRQPAKDEPR